MATVEEVIGAYMKLRLKKEAIEAAAKAEAKVYKEKMTKLEAWLKVKADEDGVTSFKTANKSVPAGVNYGTKLDINIRKPVLKGE